MSKAPEGTSRPYIRWIGNKKEGNFVGKETIIGDFLRGGASLRRQRRHEQQATFTSHNEWFGAFLRHTNQKPVTLQAVLDGINNHETLRRHLQDSLYHFTATYVGAGNGGLEIPLTQELKALRGANITITCEDPSAQLRREFLASAQKNGIPFYRNNYSQLPFQSTEYTPPPSDLIIASHVGYYIPDWADGKKANRDNNSLLKFVDAIKEGGLGLIALQSEQSDNFTIRSKWSPRLHRTKERTGEQIATTLETLGVAYTKEVIEARTDVSSCFQGKNGTFEPSDEGKLLLSFILRKDWNSLTPREQKEVGKLLTSITDKNGERVMKFKDTYIWIENQELPNHNS